MKITEALGAILIVAGLTACSEDPGKSLQQQLDERAAQSSTPPDLKAIMTKHADDLAASGILDQVSKVGDKAADFTLKNHLGEEVTLSGVLAKGPVILTWYRGGW